ncbi:MAG: SGNH/GDSL hydrolase family protein [Ktedonobacterales bacterium]
MRQSGGTHTATSGSPMTRALTFIGLSLLLVLALAGVDLLVLSVNNPIQAFTPHYYMVLGNSLSFGYQPNLDFSSGFADDIFNDIRTAGVTAVVNYACSGESTETMIHGGCVARFAHKGSYTGPQLQAAVNFLTNARNQGRASPVTLEIGANDVFADFDESTCSIGPNADADLATLDANLTETILPTLVQALTTPKGTRAGDLHLLNYYNPFAKVCPASAQFIHILNDHLQADAAKFRVSVVDVYSAFGGDNGAADHVCDYTWMCDPRFHDIHPTNLGYQVIAKAVESSLGLPGTNPLTGGNMGSLAPVRIGAFMVTPHAAAFWRRSPLLGAA